MKSLKYILFIFFLSLIVVCGAQTPGYLGRRIVLSTGVRGMPFIGKLGINENALDFNLRWSANAEFILAKNISVGYIFERVSDKVTLDNYSISQQLPIVYYTTDVVHNAAIPVESAALFCGNNHGMFVRFYSNKKNGALAPIGQYFLMEYFFNNTHIKDDGRYLNNGTNTKLHSMSSRTFVIGWGVQNVYYKYLTVGVQLGVGFNNFGFSALKDGEYDHPMFYYQESKLFSDNLIMLKLNIGWVVY